VRVHVLGVVAVERRAELHQLRLELGDLRLLCRLRRSKLKKNGAALTMPSGLGTPTAGVGTWS
jgi:hypothetical protein